jgi:hypothetical protein
VHLVGRFHIDFEGGLVTELRRHRPGARILTISMAPLDAMSLRDEDIGRADIIVYTGEQSAEEESNKADEHEKEGDGLDVASAAGHTAMMISCSRSLIPSIARISLR